jgi:hypothetical protein
MVMKKQRSIFSIVHRIVIEIIDLTSLPPSFRFLMQDSFEVLVDIDTSGENIPGLAQ